VVGVKISHKLANPDTYVEVNKCDVKAASFGVIALRYLSSSHIGIVQVW